MVEAASTATAPAPVMDVVAPPPVEKKTASTAEADPVDQLAATDQEAQQALARAKTDKPANQKKSAKAAEATHQTGVGLAITATVIIVLGLAVLATYAYIQTSK